MHIPLEASWATALSDNNTQSQLTALETAVATEYTTKTVYPPQEKIFATLNTTPLPDVKVVILGQDPYHGPGQANGLAFSVSADTPLPPSLRNIFTEVRRDTNGLSLKNGDLTPWATQGVLLLNSTLTVPQGQPGGHQHLGWEQLTDTIIAIVSASQSNVVFMLWGAFALTKRRHIDETKHLVLTAPHPSPLSAHRGFIGCGHFSQANKYLTAHGQKPIIW